MNILFVYCLPAISRECVIARLILQAVGSAANIFNHCGFDSDALAPYE
jgi:hypothetical protein